MIEVTMTNDEELIQDYSYVVDEEDPVPRPKEVMMLAEEPLFAALLRQAVAKLWPDDIVMADLMTHVVGPLSDHLAGVGAKGGDFVLERQAAGQKVEERYANDQSLRAHLVNGLFPVLHVARELQAWEAPQFRYYDEGTRRLFIAGYVLHDFVKLPGVKRRLEEAGFSHEKAVGPEQMPMLDEIFGDWCTDLGLDAFLEPLGGPRAVLHDLIYIACNTQTRWGTLRNLSLLARLTLERVQLDLAEQLSRLADLLAYTARTPQSAPVNPTLHREITTLSGGMARLTCHHLADNRGVLTNFVHNAALRAMQNEYRVPLLYAPSGVVYLEHKELAPPSPRVAEVIETTIQRIREVVSADLRRSRSGIKRDGKGMKYADFYWLFFDLPSFILLGVQATFDVIHEKKKPSSGKRFAKMRDRGWMADDVNLDLPDDLRVDQLAEWCYLAEKQVAAKLPDFDTTSFLLELMLLQDLQSQFEEVPRDNRAGGVGYHWYFAAGHYLDRHPGLDPAAWRERVESFAVQLARAVADQPQPEGVKEERTDWDDLQDYIVRTLALGVLEAEGADQDAFAAELHRYTNAKRRGRGTTQACALCSSPYRVDKQREAAVLFAPQVYSNKQPLHGSDALRSICSICSLEMMLRQNLMNRSAATGGDFEGRRVRYLFFYPTYFFTPETLVVLGRAYLGLKRTSFTELRRQLVKVGGEVDLSPVTLQRLAPLLLTPKEEQDPASDRYVRFHFPETDPVTFYFLGVPPPGRDVKDAEAWVHPAFLALLLPLCLDVKVVASEASTPILLEADEIPETVFLDGPHAAISYLTRGKTRVNVDQVLPTLQRLAVSYLIHVDANSGMGRGGFDYRWQDLPKLARDLDSSPLYAFHYLKKWQRQRKLDTLPAYKVKQYLIYVRDYLDGGKEMSHARELTTLYRQFYRANRSSLSAHNVLRPISVTARVVLDADSRLFEDQEALVEAVYGELHGRIEGARGRRLFYFPKGSNAASREKAMRAFADYFVGEIFEQALRGDKSALRGKQLNLLKNACEVIYHELEAQEQAESSTLE
jgi:CRISPR-associated protein Csc3